MRTRDKERLLTEVTSRLEQELNPLSIERLQENLIGHIMMKRRLKQPATLFFALTDDDDYLISLDNSTGEVLLERVGKRAEQVLAPSMADFLSALTPRT